MSNPKVHNIRFYKPKPRGVHCMAAHPEENKLAVSRADASIEIWNVATAPFIERTIASSTENYSIEGLAWCGSRLFSVGLHGLLIEYDLYKLDVKNRAVVTGEAAFCLDINRRQDQIAIGTEQGYLNIFKIADDEAFFEKFFDKQEGRILCLKYDHTGEYVISGSMDAIRIWSVKTGHALHKLTPGRSEKYKPTIVWCLVVTDDFTIISGDSRGVLAVWDGKVGAQLESYHTHKADILSVCLSDNQQSLYCAGIDPNIVNYERIKVKDGSLKWVRSIQRKIHDHDVRAVTLKDKKLYSSGVDGYLACSYHPPKTLLKYPPLLDQCVVVSKECRYILLRYSNFIEIWSLGTSADDKDEDTKFFQLESEPTKLVLLQKVVKTDEDEERNEGIICATMSDDGSFIFYSTRLGIRLLKFIHDEENPELIPIEMMDDVGETPCVSAIFTQSNMLITAPNSGGLQVFGLDNDTPILKQNVDDKSLEDTITLLTVSSDSKYLVVGDDKSNIAVYRLRKNLYNFYCKLPKYKAVPTALAIHPKVPKLMAAFSNCKVIEYDLENRELTDFSKFFSKSTQQEWLSRKHVIKGITFDPRVDHIILLHDDESIAVIDKNKEIPEKEAKIPKIKSKDGKDLSKEYPFKLIKKYKHLVHLSWLSDDEMVAVEVSPVSLIEQLPKHFVQNTFGRK